MTHQNLICVHSTASPPSPHTLFLVPAGTSLPSDLPDLERWESNLKRRDIKPEELTKKPVAMDMSNGHHAALVMIDPEVFRFERLTALRKAAMLLLDESPAEALIVPISVAEEAVVDAVYVMLVNAAPLPAKKKKQSPPLKTLRIADPRFKKKDFAGTQALAAANYLVRELTALPPNELTPTTYRARLQTLAREQNWGFEEFEVQQLVKMGAGAFSAVAQGSCYEGAAIVHLSYRPLHPLKKSSKHIALVGKGICFDTGGHNLKSAKYMSGMHEDMNGSAVALALMQVISDMKLPVVIDCWLAIAHNHLSPHAYKQGDIVTALDGTTIEVVHTDAEGRMVLADTLALAARQKPDLIIDFATLTGTMQAALGSRQSGIFASNETLGSLAVAAGVTSGERVCRFPLDDDYEVDLESKVADIKQCTLEGDADHILAALFLKRFTKDIPWLHMDLSASNCKGGLGAVASDLTGFGVDWGIEFIQRWHEVPDA
ncbi:MAG: leucyl aminopeptidase family protein [Rhodocyclaceae bacterium]|nr:leucyl aminopeptidase family protein [Rhodocyclaceae bacterium]